MSVSSGISQVLGKRRPSEPALNLWSVCSRTLRRSPSGARTGPKIPFGHLVPWREFLGPLGEFAFLRDYPSLSGGPKVVPRGRLGPTMVPEFYLFCTCPRTTLFRDVVRLRGWRQAEKVHKEMFFPGICLLLAVHSMGPG